MADAKKSDTKKKPVSKSQANKVASFMKQQGNGGPKPPTPADNPVTNYDDNDDDSQGA